MEQRLSVFDLSAVFTFGCIQKMRSASILPAAAPFPHRSQATHRPLRTTIMWSCGSGAQ